VAHSLKSFPEADSQPSVEGPTDLPTIDQLQQLVDALGNHQLMKSSITLLFIDFTEAREVNSQYGKVIVDEALRHISRQVSSCLTSRDILLKHGNDGFVALINDSEPTTMQAMADRFRESVYDRPLSLHGGRTIRININVTVVSAPKDGASLHDLIAAGRLRSGQRMNTWSRIH
jgi:diguanylate cyclase (GGDEF)-like protein